jgi:K+-transporting ATPase KdpF subunit
MVAGLISVHRFGARCSGELALWARRFVAGEPVGVAASISVVASVGLLLYLAVALFYPEILR